ncbi:hypothetical protein GCM10023193_02150 [Planotetraspora kaengkrachanensis]|uniref:Uncharacterized protein n=1 Tax=Planotetraspora kaengkrachanensis TaxID=575193 RepID=A0A8J3LR06_9ACTN|nr:hypothetical protein Pka01_03440 [Planotetraspora kaengkrachanensis]
MANRYQHPDWNASQGPWYILVAYMDRTEIGTAVSLTAAVTMPASRAALNRPRRQVRRHGARCFSNQWWA